MKHPRPASVLALTAGALLACSLSASAAPLPLGSVAPNFTKTKLSGGTLSLSDYAGKVVVLFLLGCT